MSGVPGSLIGIGGLQPAIGMYVQDAVDPTTSTNFIGVDSGTSYEYNALGMAVDTPVAPPGTQGLTENAKFIQWAQLDTSGPLVPTDKVVITDGVATKDNTLGTHTVFANVADGGFFWAVAN